MAKISLSPSRYMYPRPALLVGSTVDGKANFMAVGAAGVANASPPMISVAIKPIQHTMKGILQNMTFSVNIPSVDQVKELDYCGIVSGRNTDKVAACGFIVFSGSLETAPMIDQFPLNHECRVVHILDLGSHYCVVGQIEGSYVSEDYMTDGKPDSDKIRPMVFDMERRLYLSIGEPVAKSHNVGRELKKKGNNHDE